MNARATSGIGWFVAAGAVALAGIAIAAALLLRFFATYESPARFLAPGTSSVTVERPGRYVIWHEYRTVFEGQSFDLPSRLPHGVRLEVTAPDGTVLRTEPAAMTMKWGSVERAAIVAFDAAMPGRYMVAARGGASPFVLAVGAAFGWPLAKALGGALAAAVLGVGAGLALALYGGLRYAPSRAGTPLAPAAAPDLAEEKRLRDLTVLVYALQAISLVLGLTLIAGVIVNYVKRPEVAGTWLESHFDWQIRTFWWMLLWGVLGLASAVVLVGFVILFGAAIWFVYRIVRGWIALIDGRPIGAR